MSFTLTQEKIYPDNTTTLIVKTLAVPYAYCEGKTSLTTVIFESLNTSPETVEAAAEAIQRRMGITLSDFSNQLAEFAVYYTEVIGEDAFKGCTSLTSITLPSRLTKIEYGTFARCSSLTSITLPDSLSKIGHSAFRSCTSLRSITLPDSLTTIGPSAFHGCRSLTSITLPDSLTTIGANAFQGCRSNLDIHWCDQTFLPRDLVNGTLQNAWAAGCKRDRKRKRDDEAGGAKKRSFTDTFR